MKYKKHDRRQTCASLHDALRDKMCVCVCVYTLIYTHINMHTYIYIHIYDAPDEYLNKLIGEIWGQ